MTKIEELKERVKELEDENMALGRRERLKGVGFCARNPYYKDIFEIKSMGSLSSYDAKFLVDKINELLDRIRKGEVR